MDTVRLLNRSVGKSAVQFWWACFAKAVEIGASLAAGNGVDGLKSSGI